jgi:hypothetical protein
MPVSGTTVSRSRRSVYAVRASVIRLSLSAYDSPFGRLVRHMKRPPKTSTAATILPG